MINEPGSRQRKGQDSDTSSDLKRTHFQKDEIEPLSNCPYFHVILAKSHIKSPYHLIIPSKFNITLPSRLLRVVLTHHGRSWELDYLGDRQSHKRFSRDWKHFVNDNKLEVGDACVFELIERNDKTVKFKVQILRGDLPQKLLERINSAGDTSATPIIVDD